MLALCIPVFLAALAHSLGADAFNTGTGFVTASR
jgi:hypothetical protein